MFAHKHKAPIVTICKYENIQKTFLSWTWVCFRFDWCHGISRRSTRLISMAKFCATLGKTYKLFLIQIFEKLIWFFFQMLPFSDEMSLTQRWYNTMLNAYSWFVRHYSFLPSEERLAKKHFAHLAPLPPLYDIIRNVSLVLVNYHRAISPPRPFMPSKMTCLSFSFKLN